MTYLEYFELASEPFSNAPVSRFYYNSTQHSQALTRLLHSVSYMKGLSVLIGDIGAGKTTLARRMLDSLPEDEYEAALLVIIHSGITASWLLKRIALQLGVENPAHEKLALLSQLYQRLLQIYEQGKKAVVLIDEAQMLETRELMEEFRGLLNLEVPERKLISFVFFGLPEIERNLKLDAPLAQRVAMRYRLEPFSADSTEAYIKHRLRLAGCPRMPFSAAAIEALHWRSGGTPRVINTLCDNALFEAFLARSQEISGPIINQIADNLGLETGPKPEPVPAPAVTAPTAVPAVPRSAPVSAAPLPPRPAAIATQPVAVSARPPPAPPPSAPTIRPPAPVRPATAAFVPPIPATTRPFDLNANPPAAAAPAPPATSSAAAMRSAYGVSAEQAQPPRAAKLPDAVVVSQVVPQPPAAALPAQTPESTGGPQSAPPPPPPDDETDFSDDAEPLTGEVVTAEAVPAPPPSAPKRGVDLAEIDRYLEGLGKL